MSSKFLTLLTILVLFFAFSLSALGSQENPLKRQAQCVSAVRTSGTMSTVLSPSCTVTLVAPTYTAISCGNCSST
ncbi:hypothetical protein C2G38_2094321 [Gigaspora rosea]|uniref:Uncharacterized protein n=1 Tax=Gigaspora rosea TaxID=44941 RepID=A0A397UZ32_9GLOM|nr:hypothetical protein C2G38_2094321 [Gigaspora rosea]